MLLGGQGAASIPGSGASAALLAGPLGGMMQTQAKTFIETLKKSVREIRLTVSWPDGKERRSVSASQIVVILPRTWARPRPRPRLRSRRRVRRPILGRNHDRARLHAAGGDDRGGRARLIGTLTYKSFDSAYDLKQRVEAAEDRDQTVRGALDRIAREVSMTFLSEHYDRKRFRERPTFFRLKDGRRRPP